MSFTKNENGTITDNNLGLMWQETSDFERHDYYDVLNYIDELEIGR
ncbi:hypothetical protein [Cellulophaga sp. L1A9]|nr:hypothetical protein [Cellulophaga sp. L1A9]